jgi:uncharacterized protein YdhG (YjbR/CyaY superfamily)
MKKNNKPASVNEYIASFSGEVKKRLMEMRQTIKSAAPQAEEVISYQMPGYKYQGMLVYFAAFKNHISLFPASSVMTTILKEAAAYQTSKGTLQFPNSQPIPYKLITRIVKLRVKQNEEKALIKAKKKD